MSRDRRHRDIETRPDGSLVDRDTLRWYLASLEPQRVRVERLSERDPEIVAFEARGRWRAA